MAYVAKCPPLIVRLLTVFLFALSVFSGVIKRWDLFGLSLVVLLIIVVLDCYRLLSLKIDKRFDELENFIKLANNKTEK